MKRFSSILIAAASLLCALQAGAATRPHYGGTLRVAVAESPQSFDPAVMDSPALQSLLQLVFENLVRLDDRGVAQPWLASSWQVEPGDQRWRFQVRSGVTLSDGTPLDSTAVAASLRASNPQWKIFALGDLVMIETDVPEPKLPAELAASRDSIVHRDHGTLLGTGPFTITQWDAAAKHLVFSANNQYWAGRPYLDGIEVDLGRSDRDQLMLLDVGKNNLVEVAPELIRQAQSGNREVLTSSPEELLCLIFSRDTQSDAEIQARIALQRSIDSTALNNVIFQAGGEPAGALLPGWLSGYEFLFSSGGANVAAPRMRASQRLTLSLGYDPADPVAHVLADRISLNARDAGVTLQLATSENADVRLMRIPLLSLDRELALIELARQLQLAPPKLSDNSVAGLYSAENALLQTRRVIPLLHLRSAIAVRPNVHEVTVRPDGTWNLENAWLSPEMP